MSNPSAAQCCKLFQPVVHSKQKHLFLNTNYLQGRHGYSLPRDRKIFVLIICHALTAFTSLSWTFHVRAFVQPKLPSCPKFYPRIESKAQFKTGQAVALWIIVPQSFEQDALVAQLDRALDYESRGQGFESSRARHFIIAYRIFLNTDTLCF